MRRFVELIASLCLLCAPAVPSGAQQPTAGEDTRALFAAGSEAFERGDFEAALAAFEAARAGGMDNPAILYNIGVTEYKLGRYGQAGRAFRELAARYPAMRALAQYNLGLALTREDRLPEARDAFESARLSDDAKIAALAEAMLARIASAAGLAAPGPALENAPEDRGDDPDRLRLLDVGVGFDGNVALIDEASLPLGATKDSPLAQVFGLYRARPRGRLPLSVDASGYVVRYADAGEFDQTALRLGAAYAWSAPGWRLELGPYYSYSSLAGDGFERRIGASLAVRRGLGGSSSLRLTLVHEGIDDLEPQFDYVAGRRERVALDFRHGAARGRFALGYAFETNDRQGASVSPSRNEVYAGYEFFLTPDWSFEARGLLRASRYGDLVVAREEDLTELRLTGRRDLRSDWQLEGEWRVGKNASNDARYSYDRSRIEVGLSKLF